MVNPLYLVAMLLGMAFFHPLIDKLSKKVARILVTIALLVSVAIPLHWMTVLDLGSLQTVMFQTAGFKAPFSINLRVGVQESLFLMMINAGALFSAFYALRKRSEGWDGASQVLLLTLVLGVDGLVLSRDLFNIFVFMEISSISLYGLVATTKTGRAYEAGIKLMVAGGIASSLFLIGVVFLYRLTGTLNLDQMIGNATVLNSKVGSIALFLVTVSLLIELKPFPANGWAVDVYQASDPGISALISGSSATAMFFVLYKLSPLFSSGLLTIVAFSGGVTFLVSQVLAYKQDSVRRMLGYSSIGQIGLLILIIALGSLYGPAFTSKLFGGVFLAVFLLALNHFFSKMGLFWVSGIANQESRSSSSAGLCAWGTGIQGVLTSALAGFPPFPAFWAKWLVIIALLGFGSYLWAFTILLGSLIEAVYLFKWFSSVTKSADDPGTIHDEVIPDDFPTPSVAVDVAVARKKTYGWLAPALAAAVLIGTGLLLSVLFLLPGRISSIADMVLLLPLAALLVWTGLDALRLPFKVQVVLAMASAAAYALVLFPHLDGIRVVFGLIFLVGSVVQMFPLLNRKGHHFGLVGMLLALIFSLGNLLFVKTNLQLFFSWECMTVSSFFLVLRGKKASGAALRYLAFSLAGAFSILSGLGLGSTVVAASLLGIGFLVKMGSLSVHIWLPATYAELDDDLSTFFSSVLSKAGLFMLFVLAGLFSQQAIPDGYIIGTSLEKILSISSLTELLGWIGVLTAFAGGFLALFKEDIKYTLAYSSMSQVGYMLLSFALMSQLGWMNSLYLAVTHLMYKGMLFVAIGGVVYRTKTRMMYQMGGLITRMPLSFFTVLIGIIALSGVPPLTGFGSKWMLYTALIEKGWYLQAGLAMFASGIAFLYLFRLIHVIFLGQLKDEHRFVKEAPIWILIPQVVGIVGILLFSVYPSLLLKPLEAAVAPYFSGTIAWEGYTVLSTLGYWNGTAVMFVTIGVFVVPLAWLLLVQSKNTQKVSQFNIVYAAERPYRPETTHFGYNFFAPYEKALGFLKKPLPTRFWLWVVSVLDVAGGMLRKLYSGNMQTYALWIVLYSGVLLMILQGGM